MDINKEILHYHHLYNDREFMQMSLKIDTSLLFHSNYGGDKEMVLFAVKLGLNNMQDISYELRNDKEFML